MKTEDIKINVDELVEAGVNSGHTVSRLHPKMKVYVSGIKNNVNIIDPEKIAKEFVKALKFISNLVSDNKKIIFVGTKVQMKNLVKNSATESSVPYVIERWLGGTFTNFDTIQKRVGYFKDMEKKKATGDFEKYTKKERLKLDKELESLRIKFEGIRDMSKLPEAVLILDLKKDLTCAKEAKRKGIKVIALADTNVNPDMADYPIPANDDSMSSVKYILEKISEVINNTKNAKS